ncbi:MAG: nucleotidyltransferase family protein [Alphaproteobacteria bacterium]|nr:nucleotidyltransferase family protein [Alphaproteobacteria bacterium]
MILAAGLGTRMRPLTDKLPKPLISVAGKSMLERAFDHLRMAKLSRIVVNTHYLAPLITKRAKEIYPQTLISHEDILLETGGGIKKALPLLGNDPFFVLNGDSIWTGTTSLTEMEKSWSDTRMDALLLLVPLENAHGYEGVGDFFMDAQGRLCRPKRGQSAPYVYIGAQLLSPQLFQNSPYGAFSINLLWDRASENGRLYGHVHGGEWFHISTPQDLERYEPRVV